MEHTVVPQIPIDGMLTNPDAAAMRLTGDTGADLQAVARELGVTLDASGNVATQPKKDEVKQIVTETQTEAVVQPDAKVVSEPVKTGPTEVPEKFQNPDGTVNVEKLEKSTVNVDQMIARYRAKEKEAQTLQNRVNNAPVAVPATTPGAQLTPFEAQVANDLISEAAAAGYQMPQGQAIAQARVQVKLLEAKFNAEQASNSELRQRLEDGERSRELDSMLKTDPWLASPEAIDTLWQVRQENPWLNGAPKPWEAAYTFFKGRNGHGSQVKTPTPIGSTAKAPPTPVAPVARVQKTVNLNDKKTLQDMPLEDLEAAAKKLYPSMRLR